MICNKHFGYYYVFLTKPGGLLCNLNILLNALKNLFASSHLISLPNRITSFHTLTSSSCWWLTPTELTRSLCFWQATMEEIDRSRAFAKDVRRIVVKVSIISQIFSFDRAKFFPGLTLIGVSSNIFLKSPLLVLVNW